MKSVDLRSTRKRISVSLCCLLGAIYCLGGESEMTLGEMVVTATRGGRLPATIPASVTVITADDIAAAPAQNVPDILRHTAGISVSDYTGTGRQTTVDLRGFGEVAGTNLLVLVDGRRSNSADMSDVDWTTIPLERIDRIEVIRGGGSVLYGDKAVSGVINILTKTGGERTTGFFQSTYGSYGTFKEDLGISGNRGALSYSVDSSYHTTDGYRENSFLRNKSGGLRLSHDAGGILSWDLSAGIKEDNYGMPGELPRDRDRCSSDDPNNYAESKGRFIQFSPAFRLPDNGTLRLNLDHRNYQSRSFLDFGGGKTSVDEFVVAQSGVGAQYKNMIALGEYSNQILGGLNYELADKHFQHDVFNNGDLQQYRIGWFLYDTFELVPNELFLDMGYRRSRVVYGYENFGDDTFNIDSARGGLTYTYAQGSKVFLAVDRTYRTLRLEEVYGNADPLPPQISRHCQAGFKHRFGKLLTLSTTLFQIDTRDEIFYNPGAGKYGNNANYPETRRKGIEVEVQSQPTDSMEIFFNYTWLQPQLMDGNFDGKRIPGVARHRGNMGGIIELLPDLVLDVRARWVKRRIPFGDWENVADSWDDSYFLVDAKITYTIGAAQLFVGVNNIFNREYTEYGIWQKDYTAFPLVEKIHTYPSPERNFVAGVKVIREF